MTINVKGSSWNAEDTILVDNISALKAVVKQAGIVWIKGHTTITDGGHGAFVFDATMDQTLDNNGTIIDPTDLGLGLGCWVRKYDLNQYSLAFFGSDNSTVANLLESYGVDDAVVTIYEGNSYNTFKFDSTAVIDTNGIDNINGWLRLVPDTSVGDHAVDTITLLDSKSYITQEPTGLDIPLQLSFNGAEGNPATDEITMDALGAVTFQTGGHYQFVVGLQYGRTSSTGEVVLYLGWLINGTPAGNTIATQLGDDKYNIPFRTSFSYALNAGDILTTELVRDSVGVDNGGVYTFAPTLVGRPLTPSTSMVISKFVVEGN
jgi:hypothetical protein